MGDKGETSVNSCGPRNPEWETSVGDKCGDKWATSVNSCGPRHPSRRQGGDKCKLMRPKAPRVGDKGETSVNSCGPRNPEWETSVNSCGARNPEWETSVGDKWGTSGRQVYTHAAQGTQSERQVWETRGRQL